ncbi:DUF6124 family protein [Pseudomonas sp. TE3610]
MIRPLGICMVLVSAWVLFWVLVVGFLAPLRSSAARAALRRLTRKPAPTLVATYPAVDWWCAWSHQHRSAVDKKGGPGDGTGITGPKQTWERALPAKRRAGGARSKARYTYQDRPIPAPTPIYRRLLLKQPQGCPFTTELPFGPLTTANLKLFTVRPGLPAEEALLHASHLLDCIASTAYEHADGLQGHERKQGMSVYHLVEMAKPLVDAAIQGLHR